MSEASLERLWAGWRSTFVGSPRARGCLFCRLAGARTDRAAWRLARSAHSFVVLNAFPYNSGHVMVAPVRHAGTLSGLSRAERADLVELLERTERAVRRAYRPEGMNVGVNLGRCAGAGVLGHLHFHVLPRWEGDTNYMPALAGTKVLPESLGSTWKRLRAAFKEEA
jgi:ATP adenylyltransferase